MGKWGPVLEDRLGLAEPGPLAHISSFAHISSSAPRGRPGGAGKLAAHATGPMQVLVYLAERPRFGRQDTSLRCLLAHPCA
jgi:hypothetical protein